MAPKNPKPYVNSVLQLESKKFATLKNLDGLLELLKDVKKAQKPKCDQGDSSNTEKSVFIGLKEVLKRLNDESLGAVILDESITRPSTASQFFSLILKARKDCSIYVVNEISKKASHVLDIARANAIGIRKGHPFLSSLAQENAEQAQTPQISFKKPTFKVPIGKKNKSKKKIIKLVKKKGKKG